MFGLQPAHIVIIILVALIFFAPSRLPLLARGMKTMVSEFRKGIDDKNKDRKSG
jgi:Sec-independent protein translocase protein TatA